MDEVELLAQKENYSPEDVMRAQGFMRKILKQLEGQAISEKKKQELIMQAVQSVKNATSGGQ